MRLAQAAAQAADRLHRCGIVDAALEAEVLLRHLLGCSRSAYFAMLGEPLSDGQARRLDALLCRRLAREPLAYITGLREFYGLDFIVTPDTLIPRQETELLVDLALEHARSLCRPSVAIADVGTGCGAIAIALACNLPTARACASDISAAALTVADLNRRRHGVADRVALVRADMLTAFSGRFDIIVSNPPYIRSELLEGLQPEVRREPQLALDGGADGLALIRRLLAQASALLNDGGCALVEISPEQSDAAYGIARIHFPDAEVSCANDLLGLARCVVVKL